MRFMVLVKANKDSEAGVMPSTELLEQMGKYNQELIQAGVMQAGEGLHPSSRGARIRFAGPGQNTVIDGPFAETKELVAGFWMWQVASKAEAIDWLRRSPFQDTEVELRQVFETEDFGAEMTPELREQEDRQRVEVERQQQAARRQAATSIFVNLPVKDLKRSVEFFTRLGYTFNARFTDENATCMLVGDKIHVMLLVEKYFQTFTPKKVADAKSSTEALVALSCESRAAVDEIVEQALAAGARRHAEPKDHGFMYQWGFEDLDGHIWEYFWMDPQQAQG